MHYKVMRNINLKTSTYSFLIYFFLSSFINECFPNEWKNANIPVDKKGDKQIIKKYRTKSLLPICSKVFGKIIFNSHKLPTCNQLGFLPDDSCVHQLLSIIHEN